MSKPTRLTDEVDVWFYDAMELHALGEPITWEVFPAMCQVPQGVIPHIIFTVQVPGAVLGQIHFDCTQHPFPSMSKEYVEALVQQAVGRLLEFRTKELAAGNGKAITKSGLILPGQPGA